MKCPSTASATALRRLLEQRSSPSSATSGSSPSSTLTAKEATRGKLSARLEKALKRSARPPNTPPNGTRGSKGGLRVAKPPKPPLDRDWCLAYAEEAFAREPARPWLERVPGVGELVVRFVLPLDRCTPANANRHRPGWAMAKERSTVLALLSGQLTQQLDLTGWTWCADGRAVRPCRREPLPGRPMMRAIRFSSIEADDTAAWWKVPGDCLLVPRKRAGRTVPGLGLLRDDRPSALRTARWWEYAPRGKGFALIEIWTGSESEVSDG